MRIFASELFGPGDTAQLNIAEYLWILSMFAVLAGNVYALIEPDSHFTFLQSPKFQYGLPGTASLLATSFE